MLSAKAALNKDRRADRSPAFQHRHFAVIAQIIREMEGCEGYRATIAQDFANALEKTNPRFNRNRFLMAVCGVTE